MIKKPTDEMIHHLKVHIATLKTFNEARRKLFEHLLHKLIVKGETFSSTYKYEKMPQDIRIKLELMDEAINEYKQEEFFGLYIPLLEDMLEKYEIVIEMSDEQFDDYAKFVKEYKDEEG